MPDLTADLQCLVGEPVNGIWFVMDYVEVHFNGSWLRCLAPPVVEQGGRAYRFPGPGSRDALCALIDAAVTAIRAVDGEELVAEFHTGARLQVSLRHEERVGPEALHFHRQDTDETQFW